MARTVYTGYYGSLASLLGLSFLSPFFHPFTGLLLQAPVLVAVVAAGSGVLFYTLIRPSWPKTQRALVAGARGVACVMALDLAARLGDRVFWELRRRAATSFALEIVAYGRVRGMSDGLRYFKELNGDLVAYRPCEVDEVRRDGIRSRMPLADVLERDGIDPVTYNTFRRRLDRLGFIEFEMTQRYVAFVRDGLLDNLWGFVLVLPGHEPPSLGSEFVGATQLVSLRPLGRGWYYFATT